ncbi:membrane endopeptidase, M50 family [Coxiella burnetii Dugway 5J108-111]|nr:membrane endopeptidase, M50 family [Coxiella burnetii Dugway 5J108-111]
MSLAVAIIGAIIAIFGIIILHELGHFIVARACGIKVLRFSIGFGKALWRWKGKSGTEYVLAMLPLGGYVKMLGEGEEATAPKDAHRAYNQKPLLVRMMVVFAGPFTNLLLAIIAFWGVYLMGVTHTRPVIGEVIPHSIAAQAGVKAGDELIQIDQTRTKNWQQALMAIIKRMGDRSKMELKVKPLHSDRLETH